mmetsp:Transcript_9295/g.10808  ORF Transcript_9295/g.10808 Transcript_9295/m.10808 type:complete len:369 (-) Transcript_9295:111-1217(-)
MHSRVNSNDKSIFMSKKRTYPYKVDYNDHFETPLVAYNDILPLLDAVAPAVNNSNNSGKKKGGGKSLTTTTQSQGDNKNNRSGHVIYDPYYCDGRTERLLKSLGYSNVIHEKRDFYKDIRDNTVPAFNTLVTNPPYSDNHKERCVTFALEHLREREEEHRSFFILMPNYIACRDHFRSTIMKSSNTDKKMRSNEKHTDPMDILYVIPSVPYEYDHPEGTGKEISPFASIWYCGVPRDKVEKVKEAFRKAYGKDSVGVPTSFPGIKKLHGGTSSPRLVSSLNELKQLEAIPTATRKNPRQRRKLKKLVNDTLRHPIKVPTNMKDDMVLKHDEKPQKTDNFSQSNKGKCCSKRKKSVHRDANGVRKKKRF